MRKHMNSKELHILDENLAKIQMYWSNSKGQFQELVEGAVENDRHHAYRTFLMMALLLSLMSILGMLLLILIFVSGKPRLERNTFESILAKDPTLTPEQVRAAIAELKSFI